MNDQILLINNGRIIERGTHAELILNGGLYAQLYRIQSGTLRTRKNGEVRERIQRFR